MSECSCLRLICFLESRERKQDLMRERERERVEGNERKRQGTKEGNIYLLYHEHVQPIRQCRKTSTGVTGPRILKIFLNYLIIPKKEIISL